MSSVAVILPKAKPSIWKLKGDDKTPILKNKPVLSFAQPKLVFEDTSSKVNEEMNLISNRAISDLSKAAKKAVFRQSTSVKHGSIHHRLVKTSQSCRKLAKNTKQHEAPRSEVCSAPPILDREPLNVYSPSASNPPKIIINSATQKSVILDDCKVENSKNQISRSKSEINSTEKDISIKQSNFDFTPRTALSNESSCFLGVYSPDSQVPDYSHKTHSSSRSLSFTGWDWVRKRLASRETILERPNSCLTFSNFLETLSLDSDEYDTDLEDDFPLPNLSSNDRTGLHKYKQICVNKGIALAKQVVRKLSKENQTFTLSHRSLNKNDVQALAAALSENTIVKSVSLAGNDIDDEAAEPIFSMLRKNSCIKKLDLSNNKLKNDKRSYISRVLTENSTLTHVTLSQNMLGDKEALLLSEALRSNYSMEYLNLSHNRLSDLGGQSIAAALIDNDFLTSLDLSWNVLGKRAASALGTALKTNSSLLSLDVSYNGFGDDGTAVFGRSLHHNSTLRLLSLAVNHIGSFGSEMLALGICGSPKKGKKSKSNIKSLNLSRNPLGSRGIWTLVKHMEEHDTLYELRIDEVLLSSDASSVVKRLKNSSNAVLFYEGQDEQDRKISAMRLGARYLSEILRNQFKPKDFFSEIDPDDGGVTIDQLKSSLEKLDPTPSELELHRLLSCLCAKASNLVRFSDVYNSSTRPRVAFKLTSNKAKRKPRI